MRDLTLTVTEAMCPSCGTALQKLPSTVGVIAGCFSCGGLWVDNRAASTFVQMGVPSDVVALVSALPAPEKPEAEDQDYRTNARSKRGCPVCKETLEQRPFRVAGGSVELDLCAAHGTFFDPRELAALSGGFTLGKLRPSELQAEADRIRDAASPLEVDLGPLLFLLGPPNRMSY